MAINQLLLSNPTIEYRDEQKPDKKAPRTPFRLTPYLKREFVKIILLELALFQMHIIFVVVHEIIETNEKTQAINFFSFLTGLLTFGAFILVFIVVGILSVPILLWGFIVVFILSLLSIYPSDPNHANLLLTTVTIPFLFILDWRLPSAFGMDASEDDKRRLKRWKMIVRWLGHLLLVVLTVIYALEMENKFKTEYGFNCHMFLTTGILGKTVVDSSLHQNNEFLKSVKVFIQWIPMKWIVMLLYVYLPLIGYNIFHFILYRDSSLDLFLALPLAEAVILTMCTAYYEEMRQLHGARSIALSAAPVALAGVLFHCSQYGSDLIEIGIGGVKGIAMWTAHFGMAKIYV